MKKTLLAALCASTLGLGACDLQVPDLNNPSLESLRDSPTPSGVKAASTGLLIGGRAGKSTQNGYVAQLGILGRESYTFDAGDPRFVTEMLSGASLDPGSPAFGGSQWSLPYANIRNANTVLGALEKVSGISDADKEAIRGFAKTMQALDFLVIVTTRDTNGGPIDVGGDYSQLAPIVSKEQMLEHIATLLDQSKTHLAAASDEFPFPLSSGYEGFDTPATFLKFNRAVRARTAVYQENWQAALQALSESFVDRTKPMSLGVYIAFGTGSGDTSNGLTSPNLFAHPSIVTDAERKPDCTDDAAQPFKCLDDRVKNKIKVVESRSYQGLTSNLMFTMYSTNSSPLAIIRNEDLLLLRAEANIRLSNYPAAEVDINHVRAVSGGLPPVSLVGENGVDVLLKERRYSLLYEGGHRWIDMRRYERLDALPKDKPDHTVHPRFPIPVAEADARQ
jgi:starch-binding outer membrane protein, SusD/RagB family